MKINKYMIIAAIVVSVMALVALALRGLMIDGQWKTTITLSAIMILVAEASYLLYRIGLDKIKTDNPPRKEIFRKLNWHLMAWSALILADVGLYSLIGTNVIGEYIVRVIFIGLLSFCISNRKIRKAVKKNA